MQPATKDKAKEFARYTLVLPRDIYTELQDAAKEQGVSVIQLLRKFIKLGLTLTKLLKSPGASLIIREGDSERQILLF